MAAPVGLLTAGFGRSAGGEKNFSRSKCTDGGRSTGCAAVRTGACVTDGCVVGDGVDVVDEVAVFTEVATLGGEADFC